ncbi:putative DNA-directed RNA polymerases I, II, and III subunit RPABC5-like [Capsicum annuum]|nr:putative DNA-directed RNA polymerases I, II, and III subunit RPABC5-like [Capsicum annuum]KAF3668197.1 putative DNA-directed RNA polymerases I, II, and III subunit RPABC5-like [Capsicum annuum]
MGTAGGLSSLAKMPAFNVHPLGAGFSTATSQFHIGYIEQTELFQSTPPSLRMRACRLLAAKSTLAARVDSINGDPSGKTGRSLTEEIRDGLVEGYGMLGKAGSGKLRVSVGQSKLAAKVAKKFKEKSYGSSGATSGLTSSLAFTPGQVDGNKIVYNHVSIDVLDLREPVILYCIVACPNDFNCSLCFVIEQYQT